MSSYQYRKSHYGDKTVVRSGYWIRVLVIQWAKASVTIILALICYNIPVSAPEGLHTVRVWSTNITHSISSYIITIDISKACLRGQVMRCFWVQSLIFILRCAVYNILSNYVKPHLAVYSWQTTPCLAMKSRGVFLFRSQSVISG